MRRTAISCCRGFFASLINNRGSAVDTYEVSVCPCESQLDSLPTPNITHLDCDRGACAVYLSMRSLAAGIDLTRSFSPRGRIGHRLARFLTRLAPLLPPNSAAYDWRECRCPRHTLRALITTSSRFHDSKKFPRPQNMGVPSLHGRRHQPAMEDRHRQSLLPRGLREHLDLRVLGVCETCHD